MKTKINLPGFTAELAYSYEGIKYQKLTDVVENGNNIIPQNIIAIFGLWALRHSAYAGCWYACVATKGLKNGDKCGDECSTLIF